MEIDDAAAADARTLREAGLPTWYQPAGYERAWLTAITLPATAALRPGPGGEAHVLVELGEPADDEVPLQIETEGRWPAEVQFLNWHWLTAMDAELADALLGALFAGYPAVQEAYAHLPAEVRARCLPPVATPADLRPLVALRELVLHAVPHASTPYLGATFACAWDEEHGAGVLLYGTEPLDVGGADVALDGGRALAHRQALLKALE